MLDLRRWLLLAAAGWCAGQAHASIGVLVAEPFGAFGTMMPNGHTSIYFDHICAATPTSFRRCTPGEHGAVLSRYHDLQRSELDWLATPVLPFLYGVDEVSDTPAFVTRELETSLRERYRQAHLEAETPRKPDRHGQLRPPPYGDWAESIGATFDRRLFLYEIDTTAEQDAALLAWLNALPDQRRYTLRHANCADLAADAINVLYPGTVEPNTLGDFGIMSPEQVARRLDALGRSRPDLHLRVYMIPQLPGTLRRSRSIRSGTEAFLKTKRYLVTLLVIQPEFVLADWMLYEKRGKWTPGLGADLLAPAYWLSSRHDQPSRSTSSSTSADSIGLRAK